MVQALLHGVAVGLEGLALMPPWIHFWIVFTKPVQCKHP